MNKKDAVRGKMQKLHDKPGSYLFSFADSFELDRWSFIMWSDEEIVQLYNSRIDQMIRKLEAMKIEEGKE